MLGKHFILATTLVFGFCGNSGLRSVQAHEPEIFFDLPLHAAAVPAKDDPNGQFVEVELRLSSMIVAPDPKRIDQWIVRCQPRDESIQIADYAPRTEVASQIQGPIQIRTSDENSRSVGVSVDGTYGHLIRGNMGADRGNKKTESIQYERVAPVQAVTAAGTINRGRGVYFKLKWTEQQVLEGEKVFHLTLSVPPTWRAGLIDVSVIAQSENKSFAKWDREVVTLGKANFVVAVYGVDDSEASLAAKELADAEQSLRQAAQPSKRNNSVSAVLRSVAGVFDPKMRSASNRWLDRLLAGVADPYADNEILDLPVQTRVMALDYYDARDSFVRLRAESDRAVPEATERYVAARHPVSESNDDSR